MKRTETLFVTHCSAGKNKLRGDPLSLYTSSRIQRFGNWCKGAGVMWAIVSAKHGLFFPDEQRDPYDTTFKFFYGDCIVVQEGEWLSERESQAHVHRLVEGMGARLRELEIRRVVFYLGGAFERVSPCYLLVVHRALDACTDRHDSRQDLLDCISGAGRLSIASGETPLRVEFQNLR